MYRNELWRYIDCNILLIYINTMKKDDDKSMMSVMLKEEAFFMK